jgi:hypothetical protein
MSRSIFTKSETDQLLARIRELEAALREIAECRGYPTVMWQETARAALNTQTGRVDPAPLPPNPAPKAEVNRR